MPVVSSFYGIIIHIYKEIGEKHKRPHIHARFAEFEAAVDLDGNLIEGYLPPSKMKLLIAWMEIHHDELLANWSLISEGYDITKIDPLR